MIVEHNGESDACQALFTIVFLSLSLQKSQLE